MTYADQDTASSEGPWANWWEDVSAEAHARQLEQLEHGMAIPRYGPSIGVSRVMLFANFFQPTAGIR